MNFLTVHGQSISQSVNAIEIIHGSYLTFRQKEDIVILISLPQLMPNDCVTVEIIGTVAFIDEVLHQVPARDYTIDVLVANLNGDRRPAAVKCLLHAL